MQDMLVKKKYNLVWVCFLKEIRLPLLNFFPKEKKKGGLEKHH